MHGILWTDSLLAGQTIVSTVKMELIDIWWILALILSFNITATPLTLSLTMTQ